MTFVVMILLVVVNFTNVIAEFVGIAGSMSLFHLSKYVSVPICAGLGLGSCRQRRLQKSRERSSWSPASSISPTSSPGVLSQPDWHNALVETIKLPPRKVWSDKAYVYMTVGVIGTTITPWMQFYLQSSIVEKGVTVRQMKASRLDVIVGSIFTDIVAWFIVVACAATLFAHGIHGDSRRLRRRPGHEVHWPATTPSSSSPSGLFNASLFAASILPLSTAYTVCEGLGFESGLDKSWNEAPFFYWFYSLAHRPRRGHRTHSALPDAGSSRSSRKSSTACLLPVVLIFMLKLINKHELMGKYVNSLLFNMVVWAMAVIVIGLTVVYIYGQVHG